MVAMQKAQIAFQASYSRTGSSGVLDIMNMQV